jgi:hypothetical protein
MAPFQAPRSQHMTTIDQVTVRWVYPSGTSGGPGYSIFFGPGLSTYLGSLRTFYSSCAAYLPNNMTLQFIGSGVQIDSASGRQVGDWTNTPPADVVSAVPVNTTVSTSGFIVDWRTSGRNWRGRKIRGKTFFVPAAGSVYTSAGAINTTAANTINTAATGLMNTTAGALGVWSRPVYEKGPDGKPTDVLLHAGVIAAVTSTNVPLKAVVLRSRRD